MSLDREEPNHFGAGPAQLPTPVLQQAAKDLVNYKGIGLGIGEISHRSGDATEVIESTKANLRKLLNVPETHEVFFMQGGGTTGFSSLATNLVAAHVGKTGSAGTAGYLVTGSWSAKALEEAQRLGIESEMLFNAKDYNNGKFGAIPPESAWAEKLKAKDYSYVYLCENETVHGVEWPQLPKALVDSGIEIVADLSSDILSRAIDVSQYGVIMAGAQKNIGLAGLTLYIIKKSILQDISAASLDQLRQLGVPITPIAFEYPTVVKNNSAYNTIPIFTLHIVDLVLRHVLEKGGLAAQEEENDAKSQLLYNVLDKHSDFYKIPVSKDCRSRMNVVFTLKKEGFDKKFLDEAAKRNLTGLKGHRSVGGFRASLYNAVSLDSTKKLVQFVDEFATQNA
ncbi:O-phospho-L-serine:2-oxoglutarate transaminase [Lachancea thermotolerans CBS 6340]|uniref:Phosphoserine aminotransferase n=1 Tax=Lachancea thermotolerans (strain ATCC 56472 / CBS 6340 / NRRL Y-8284) TaxID=559295 RepID=C5DN86_LACTC|nr:KLTH0G14982p [Lachancea thermotolerans CBS 6340]CAR25247.1 KLTH0G14982p [Lachancea thermotolerans CBS 6340]